MLQIVLCMMLSYQIASIWEVLDPFPRQHNASETPLSGTSHDNHMKISFVFSFCVPRAANPFSMVCSFLRWITHLTALKRFKEWISAGKIIGAFISSWKYFRIQII